MHFQAKGSAFVRKISWGVFMKGSEAEKNLAKTESWVRVTRVRDVSNELLKQFHDEKRYQMESMVYQTVRRHCWFSVSVSLVDRECERLQ